MIELHNAIIKSAGISNEDHGVLSAWLGLDYGGNVQGFGGYILYSPKRVHQQGNYAGHFIWRVLEVAGVTSWGKLEGKTIRVKSEHSKVHAIGHIVRDLWFNPSDEFEKMKEEIGEES